VNLHFLTFCICYDYRELYIHQIYPNIRQQNW
jgi:hypothetical protein